ncbi:cytosol aminopeptidase [Escherichia coli]|uniref:Cytosol aminopeptidase n=1 Tax=Escherichia coli TaxID=562 RepID=A0A376L505_ECOLX|nr:cytosol aminopeptidase [Escherichia coli]
MVFNVPTRRELTSGERAIQHGLAIAAGLKQAKDLGNMPRISVTPLTSLHKRASLG